jgi:hypothetical protein
MPMFILNARKKMEVLRISKIDKVRPSIYDGGSANNDPGLSGIFGSSGYVEPRFPLCALSRPSGAEAAHRHCSLCQ